jgi:hypothetical protein
MADEQLVSAAGFRRICCDVRAGVSYPLDVVLEPGRGL